MVRVVILLNKFTSFDVISFIYFRFDSMVISHIDQTTNWKTMFIKILFEQLDLDFLYNTVMEYWCRLNIWLRYQTLVVAKGSLNGRHVSLFIPFQRGNRTIREFPNFRASNMSLYIHHHHQDVSPARISLTISRHFSLSFITSGRSSGLHPVSLHSCCM